MMPLHLFIVINLNIITSHSFRAIAPTYRRSNTICHHKVQQRQEHVQRTSMFLGPNEDNDHNKNSDPSITTTAKNNNNNNNDEAQRLLDKVKQMRMEIAALTGQSIEDVEREAALKKTQQMENEEMKKKTETSSSTSRPQRQYIVPVPETVAEQIQQAANAIERAYNDGNIQKQIIRFAFVPIVTSNDPFRNNNNNNNNNIDLDQQSVLFVRNDQDWPGGIQQIYREAAQPYTFQLLQQLRIQPQSTNTPFMKQKPNIQEETLWDFDGSSIITATTTTTIAGSTTEDANTSTDGTGALIQALVHPNTDNRYFNDIQQIDERLSATQKNNDADATTSKGGVNLIINPFWNNATSWGFNIFAPKAQQRAKDIIFSPSTDDNMGGYIETYNVITKSVRGEDCIAIKAYPYDWQLYAYLEEMNDRRYYSMTNTVHLGSTVTEPTITDFVQLLSNRTEFQYSKNMRQMQRMNK